MDGDCSRAMFLSQTTVQAMIANGTWNALTILSLVLAVACLMWWVAKLEYRLGETQADVNRLANMVSDLRLAAKAKE